LGFGGEDAHFAGDVAGKIDGFGAGSRN
jgi:hypothetical protein